MTASFVLAIAIIIKNWKIAGGWVESGRTHHSAIWLPYWWVPPSSTHPT